MKANVNKEDAMPAGNFIDADAHMHESEETWKFFETSDEYPSKPARILFDQNKTSLWVVNGRILPKPVAKGTVAGRDERDPRVKAGQRAPFAPGAIEMTDIETRVRDMDELGVKAQVIYPTFFIHWITDEVNLEKALCKSYNRFMAEATSKAPDRLRWAAVLPLRSIPDAISEMRYAKDGGAVSVFMRGIEGDRTLDDPYFFPIYEEAMKLDMAIGVHTGSGCPAFTSLFDSARNSKFGQIRVLPVFAFRDIVGNEIPERFPSLRFGFLEAGSQWVPYVLYEINIWRIAMGKEPLKAPDVFKAWRLYVACDVSEDLPWVIKYAGEENIVLGTDYGHKGIGTNPASGLRDRGDLPREIIEKIELHNPKRLYAL